MKLLNKLLPFATIASAAVVVAPVITSCGSGIDPTKYEAKFTPADAKQYNTAADLAKAYFGGEKAKDYIKDDVFIAVKGMIGSELPEGASVSLDFSVTGIDTTKGTISAKASGSASYSVTQSGKTYKASGKASVTVTDIPYLYGTWKSDDEKYFALNGTRTDWQTTSKVVVSISYSMTGQDDFSGDATITKDKAEGTIKQEVLAYLDYAYWTSNYFSLATVK